MIGKRIYSGSPFEAMAGYARAVVDGDMVYVSGTTGFVPETGEFPEGVVAQCEQCFRNVGAALGQAGANFNHMLRIRVFIASREEFELIKPIIKRHCDAARPANTTIICDLAEERMRVEVEVTARIPAPVPQDADGAGRA
ncbi:MAG: RidA family protein [Rhodospirillaceae bacterium]|nr:RidA family protein [Rhodospirillaceae bacterium]MBT5265630.1 RidA family protein [Rhodospirillaceae bacterium]MBT6137498.1 RidA family protein [Rhodospirillaceae bacterium]